MGEGTVSFEPIAKLSRRIAQRFIGTRGVFLSMSGYTDEPQADMLRGPQPDMLLLDQTHFEAMLSGLLWPKDLFTELIDRAAYRGEVYVPLKDILVQRKVTDVPGLALGGHVGYPVPVVTETAPGVDAEVVLHAAQTTSSLDAAR